MSNTQIVIGPNASLTATQALWVMASISAVALTVAAGFAVMGFWPILPFAGLELSALGAALWVSLRRNRYREVLVFDEQRVRIGFGWMGQGASAEIDWARGFTRVLLEQGLSRNSHSRLLLTSSGQSVQVGRCLSDDEREQLHGRIKNLLPPHWCASAGAVSHPGGAQAPV